MADNLTRYFDGSTAYLELHAMRSPVGGYAAWITNNDAAYDYAVAVAIEDFEQEHHVKIFTLGRSGRHICVEDTPENRRRYRRLSKAAITAANVLWQDMRTEREPDAQLSEN